MTEEGAVQGEAAQAAPDPAALAPARAGTRRDLLDWGAGLSALSLPVIALGAAAAQWSLYAATDLDTAQLAWAALLLFGLAALVAVPFGVYSWWALRGRARPVWTALLLGPWAAFGMFWAWRSTFDPALGAIPAAIAALGIWQSLRAKRKTRV